MVTLPKGKKFWFPVIKKMTTKLCKWKCKTLNKAGRAVLIKSSLNSIPEYWVNLFRTPKWVSEEIEKIKRNFFWDEICEECMNGRKLHTINWHQVCLPKDKGGLGLGDLNLRNVAALIKWWWRINKDKTSLWRRILIDKYGAELL